jgi:hypothetical protein
MSCWHIRSGCLRLLRLQQRELSLASAHQDLSVALYRVRGYQHVVPGASMPLIEGSVDCVRPNFRVSDFHLLQATCFFECAGSVSAPISFTVVASTLSNDTACLWTFNLKLARCICNITDPVGTSVNTLFRVDSSVLWTLHSLTAEPLATFPCSPP